jgi:hypothetical protein
MKEEFTYGGRLCGKTQKAIEDFNENVIDENIPVAFINDLQNGDITLKKVKVNHKGIKRIFQLFGFIGKKEVKVIDKILYRPRV